MTPSSRVPVPLRSPTTRGDPSRIRATSSSSCAVSLFSASTFCRTLTIRRVSSRRATRREGGVLTRTLPGRERVDRSVRDSLPRVPGPEGPRLRRRSPRGTRRFPGVPARGRSEEDAEQVLGARAERARGVRSGGTPRASRGSGRGPEDAPPRPCGRRERSDVLQRPRGAPARPSIRAPPEDECRCPLSRGPRGRDRRGRGENAPRRRVLREDGRSPASAQPLGDRLPAEGRPRRGSERGYGPSDPAPEADQRSEGHPARLRTAPASIRGSDGPRRDLEDRLQVRLPLPRLRGRPGDPACEVPRPRGPERPPRGVAGNQPSGPTRTRSEETDPLR